MNAQYVNAAMFGILIFLITILMVGLIVAIKNTKKDELFRKNLKTEDKISYRSEYFTSGTVKEITDDYITVELKLRKDSYMVGGINGIYPPLNT